MTTRKVWWMSALLVMGIALVACGPAGKSQSVSVMATATPNPGGGEATPAPTMTPTSPPPTQVPVAATIAGVWTGGYATATRVVIAECNGTAFAAFTLPNGAPEEAAGPATTTAATLNGIAYQNHAPAYKDTWTMALQAGGALQVTLERHPIEGGNDTRAKNTLTLSTTSIPGAPDFSGTWTGTQNTQTDQIPIRFVINQCGPVINADIYLSQNNQLPSSPQETGLGTLINGQMAVETTFSVSAGYFFYDRWSLNLAGGNQMNFSDFTHYLDPGDTTPDSTTTGSATR